MFGGGVSGFYQGDTVLYEKFKHFWFYRKIVPVAAEATATRESFLF